jgi:thioester reductase-like protein
MKILLTGATGYIGKRLLPVLVGKGHTVICCVRGINRFNPPESIKSNIEPMIKHPYYDSNKKKRADESALKAIIYSLIGIIIIIICKS